MVVKLNSQETPNLIGWSIPKKLNLAMKQHLDRDGNKVIVVNDGVVDVDKEIQSELKNAGLQNILKLQELRYGTIDNAIVRAADKGIYADISNIPTDVAGQAEFIAKAQKDIAKLKAEYGLSDSDLESLTAEKLLKIYQDKQAAAESASQEGGAQ